MSNTEKATVAAQKDEVYAGIAGKLFDKGANEIVKTTLDSAEVVLRGSAHLLDYWVKNCPDILPTLPVPHTYTSNNPDIVLLREMVDGKWKERPISSYKLIVRHSAEGIEIVRRRNEIKSKGVAITPEETAELDRIDSRENNLVKKAREAAALYHQIVAANDMKLDNDLEMRAKLIREKDIPTGQVQLEAGNWQELKTGEKVFVMVDGKTASMTVPQFLSLNFEPFDSEKNPTGYKEATFDGIRKASKKGTNSGGAGGNDKANGEAPKFSDINRKNVTDFANALASWLEDQDGKYWTGLTDEEQMLALDHLAVVATQVRAKIAKKVEPIIQARKAA